MNVLYPNPVTSWEPVNFNYNLTGSADQVKVKIFTLAFRKIYEDDSLPTVPGSSKYTLNLGQGDLDIANGLYYVVLEIKAGGLVNRQIMKLLIQR